MKTFGLKFIGVTVAATVLVNVATADSFDDLQNKDAVVRRKAAEQLLSGNDQRLLQTNALPLISGLLFENDVESRAKGVIFLTRLVLAQKNAELARGLAEQLTKILLDPRDDTFRNDLLVLGRLEPRVVIPISFLSPRLKSPDPITRGIAINALALFDGEDFDVQKQIFTFLQGTNSTEVSPAIDALPLLGIPSEKKFSILLDVIQNKDASFSDRALWAVQKVGEEPIQASADLRRFVMNKLLAPNTPVSTRLQCLAIIHIIASKDSSVLDALVPLVGDESASPEVRTGVIQIHAKLGIHSKAFAEQVQLAKNSKSERVKAAASAVLGSE